MDKTSEENGMPEKEPEEVTIIVHSATGLKSKLGGSRKYFVVFGLGETKYQTGVIIDKAGNPVWKEENAVTVDSMKDEVFLVVREKDNVHGQVLVPVSTIQGPKDRIHKQQLQPHKKCRNPHGELTYQCFVSKYRDSSGKNEKKKKFRLGFQGEELEKIAEGDSYTSDLTDVEQIDLDDLINNAQAEKQRDQTDKSPDNNLNDQKDEIKDIELKENGLNSPSDNELDFEVANAKDTLSKATGKQKSSMKNKSKQNKKKKNEKVKLDLQTDGIDSDHTESVTSDQSEKEKVATDAVEKKNNKKRFSLNFLRRKKLLDQTKIALGNENAPDQDNEHETENQAEVHETVEINGKYWEEEDKQSVDSENSQTMENENYKEAGDVQILYTVNDIDIEETNQDMTDGDIRDFSMENKDYHMTDGMENDESNSEQTDDHVHVTNINVGSGSKKEKISDFDEPESGPSDKGKGKSKKKFSLKFLVGGSDDVDEEESQSTPEKDKVKWKIPLLSPDKEEKQPVINKCTPDKGPVDEPTRVCIEGFCLGTGKTDITSLKVAGCDCLDTIEYESPEKICCKTHFQFEPHTGPVEIITKSGGQGILENGFTFFDELEAYTHKNVSFKGDVKVESMKHGTPELETMENLTKSPSRTTDDVTQPVTMRPKTRKLSRSCSETELHSRYKPNSYAEEQTDAMFRVRQGRRLTEMGLKPRRKAPPVPEEDDMLLKVNQRRASESAIRFMARGLISSNVRRASIESDDSLSRRSSSEISDHLQPKRKAPPPPANSAINNFLKERHVRGGSAPQLENQRLKNLHTVHEDSEPKEDLLEKIKKLEEEKAALAKDVTRLRSYIDNLVSKVMDRCPTALLQDNHLKTNFFL